MPTISSLLAASAPAATLGASACPEEPASSECREDIAGDLAGLGELCRHSC